MEGKPKDQQGQQLIGEALDCYQRSIELDSMNKDAWAKKANLLKEHLGQLKEAEICYKQAFQIDPDDKALEASLQEVMLANRRSFTS